MKKKLSKAVEGSNMIRAEKTSELKSVKDLERGAHTQTFNPKKPSSYSFEEEEGLFSSVEIVKRIVTIPLKDSLREGFDIRFDNEKDQVRFDNYIASNKLNLKKVLYKLAVETRKHGTAVLFPIVKDSVAEISKELGSVTEVLGFNIIKEDKITNVKFNEDFTSENYGDVEELKLEKDIIVHPSRVLISWNDGDITTKETKNLGVSTLNKLSQELTGYNTVKWSLTEIAYRLSFIFFKSDKRVAESRSEQQEYLKDINTLTQGFIDKEDDVITVNSGAGINPETWIVTFLKIISATTGIPVQRILGNEAGAVTGSEENRIQYREVLEAIRQFVYEEPLYFMIDLICSAINLGSYEILWPELLQKSEEEKMKIKKIKAETLKIFFEAFDKARQLKKEESISNVALELADEMGIDISGIDLEKLLI